MYDIFYGIHITGVTSVSLADLQEFKRYAEEERGKLQKAVILNRVTYLLNEYFYYYTIRNYKKDKLKRAFI